MTVTSTISPALKIGLRFLGVWPNVPYSTIYPLIYMSSILVVQYFQYMYLFAHLKNSDLPDLVDSLPPTLDYTLTVLKLIILWVHRRVVHQILVAMDSDWRECVNVEQRLHVMTIKASISYFCSNAMISINAISAVLYLLAGYVVRLVYLAEEYNDTIRQLPIKIQFPFDAEESPVFEMLVVTLFLHVMLNSYTLAVLNALIFTLVLHMSGQIDIVCQEFRTISDKITFYRPFDSTLGMLIEKHNRIISFSENIDKLFSFMALMQIIWNTLVICCLGFVIIISVSEADIVLLVKTSFTYVAVMLEVFIFCFAGEYLSLKSKAIGNAAYESLWYNIPLSQHKMVSFIIMRSQKQLTITAGRITNLSLEAFAGFIKASASYVSVLHAIY